MTSYSALKSYSSEEGIVYMEEKLSMEEDPKCLKEVKYFNAMCRHIFFYPMEWKRFEFTHSLVPLFIHS